MPSSLRFADVFGSLSLATRIWIFLWTYLAVGGWFSTYMLISNMSEARRNEMIELLMLNDIFIWTVGIMLLSSFVVVGLLFYGRYARKKKEVIKAALKKYEETRVYVEPNMRFDPAVFVFWIGGSVLSSLFSICILVAAIEYAGVFLDPPVMYMVVGFGLSFFIAVLMYLVTQVMANGVLDAKAVKSMVKALVGSDTTRKIIGTVCKKTGIMEKETVDRVYEKVKDRISAKEYDELTPDEILIISMALDEKKAKLA